MFSRLLINLTEALSRNTTQSRAVLKDIFEEVNIELRGPEVWAQIHTSPELRMAVGAYDDNTGCGSRI
ncbi:hypothetical protein [Azomonas macrocytogenes]|uniref:hypothetical protein n=1 Tax=Azomonas macrocytogenes TaxID=69962 RepID=UPI0016068EEE|nr:hypothetical protein [Azomonas macrocytogenes]